MISHRLKIIFPIAILLLIASCSQNQTTAISDWKAQIDNSKLDPFNAVISDLVWRVPRFEANLSVTCNSTGSADEITRIAREITSEAWSKINSGEEPPVINILLYGPEGLFDVDKKGVGHIVPIVLNLPTDKISYVNFSASWCDTGAATDKAMSRIKQDLGDKVYFETYDTDMDLSFTALANVVEIPSQMIFDKTGNLVGFYPGPLTEDEIREKLNPLL